MKFVGIDYSITSPSITVFTGSRTDIHFLSSKKKWVGKTWTLADGVFLHCAEYPTWSTDEERHLALASWALCCIPSESTVLIEGYSFGSTGSRLFQLAENCGCLKQNLYTMDIPFQTAPPTTIKKFATGRGNCKKDLMIASFFEKTGIDIPKVLELKEGYDGSPVSDIVDSWFMCQYLIANVNRT